MPGGKDERGGKEGGFQKCGTIVKRILTFSKSTLALLISREQCHLFSEKYCSFLKIKVIHNSCGCYTGPVAQYQAGQMRMKDRGERDAIVPIHAEKVGNKNDPS